MEEASEAISKIGPFGGTPTKSRSDMARFGVVSRATQCTLIVDFFDFAGEGGRRDSFPQCQQESLRVNNHDGQVA